jgi:hypothetical protein
MLIQWKRWVVIDIHMDHSSPLRMQWSSLCQVLAVDGEASIEFESEWAIYLVEEIVLL